ncbi:MAG TPA: FadR/GntR family transcriptional regulator [Oscillatoriaceae cyanobacterium]
MLDELGRSIVTGSFAGEDFPIEAELAKRYGVSRSVTREAVKMLTAKGLLGARPRQGTFVQPEAQWNLLDPDVLRWLLERKFSMSLLRGFTELRVAIEPAAAELAARNLTPEGQARLEAGYARMVAAHAGDDDPLDADIAFHVAVLEASGNVFFAQFRDMVATALRTSIRFTNRFRGVHTASLPAHKAVKDAIEARDTAGAHAAMATMMRNVMLLIAEAEAKEASKPS